MQSVIIHTEKERNRLAAKGWKDTPADFAYIPDFGVDPDSPEQVQRLGDAIVGVAAVCNGSLRLQTMTKPEIITFIDDSFGKKIDKRLSLKNMRSTAQSMVANGNSG